MTSTHLQVYLATLLLLLRAVQPGQHDDENRLHIGFDSACKPSEIVIPRCDADIRKAAFNNTIFHKHVNLSCWGALDYEWGSGVHPRVISLTLRGWAAACLPVRLLEVRFPELRHLEVLNSTTLRNFNGVFTHKCKLETVRMHGLSALRELPRALFGSLDGLRTLDLRSNALLHMRAHTIRGPINLKKVFMTDNRWDCSDGGLDWLALENENGKARSRIVDYNKLMCHQRLYRGKPLHKVMDIIREVRTTCPQSCSCVMTNVVTGPGGEIVPVVTVDCAARNLTAAPPSLPPNTAKMVLNDNRIESLRSMVQMAAYRNVSYIHLDNNRLSVSSLQDLEGWDWLTTGSVLSVRGNSLTNVPIFALDNGFIRNQNLNGLYLGNNSWRCDCHYLPKFQRLLQKYRSIIKDLDDIRCGYSEDKEISMAQVTSLSLIKVCRPDPHPVLGTIDIVNLVLASLLLLVLANFSYDFYRYKRTGNLPWIATKLP